MLIFFGILILQFTYYCNKISLYNPRTFTMSVHENGLKFIQLSRYAPMMVKDIRRRMSMFIGGLSRASSKEGRVAMLIGDMEISRLMVYI